MNQKIQFKITTLLLLVPLFVLANTNFDGIKSTKERSIKKSFDVSSNATLKINNSFGNLDVTTWNENRIDIDVTIKVTGNNEDKVIDRLNRIDVEFSSSNDMVTAITKIGKNNKNWWNWGKKMNLKLEINYLVKMPITGNIELSNDYGSINLAKLEGNANISCDYGKITTQELMGATNKLSFDYTNNCYFEYINNGKIVADYSSFTVANAKNIELTADYTKSIIENVENVAYTCDYGSLKVDNVNNFSGNGDYLTLRLGNVFKNVQIGADYGSIKIDRMASKAGNIEINTEFTGITIGIDPSYSFDFDINLEYASLNYPETFNFSVKERDNTEKTYRGYNGSSNTGNIVKIDSEYGSVSFKIN